MAQTSLVPLYYDGQDRKTQPIAVKTHKDIKAQRKAGELHGWYVDNGNTFVVYRPPREDKDPMLNAAGSGFDKAWHLLQSGYAGPLVWQLRSQSPHPTV